MNAATEHLRLAGPAGELQVARDLPPPGVPLQGLALVCHPHPLHGGTMDNKVVQTLARALLQRGCAVWRFNFRGVGASAGQWDDGQGEIDDAQAVLSHALQPAATPSARQPLPVVLAGFSFGAYVAAKLCTRRHPPAATGADAAGRDTLVLVGPAVRNFDVGSVPAETLVVHGEQDDVVPLAAVLDWARPQSLPVTVLPGAGHFFHGQLPALRQILSFGLSARLPGA